MAEQANNYPKLHNAAWPGIVGKGTPDSEPIIPLDTLLKLTDGGLFVKGERFLQDLDADAVIGGDQRRLQAVQQQDMGAQGRGETDRRLHDVAGCRRKIDWGQDRFHGTNDTTKPADWRTIFCQKSP